jgi:Na+-transporting NADH:ubiquinone oxidoreductase subunit F
MQKDSIDLIIRLVPEGLVTTWVHRFLESGERVKFTGPMGDFRYHEGEGEIILVAGGSGMAPMIPLLDELSDQNTQRKITYFFGAVSKRDLFYLDRMKEYEKILPSFTFVPALSQPDPEDQWEGVTGLITEPLDSYLKQVEIRTAQAYLCGSPGMIKACIDVFHQHELKNDSIFFDPFA